MDVKSIGIISSPGKDETVKDVSDSNQATVCKKTATYRGSSMLEFIPGPGK